MKKFRLLSHVAVVSASVSFASSSFALDAAYWLPAATDWAAFGLPDNWAIGSRDSGTHAVPGTGHSVVMDQNMKFDLNGGSYALGGLTGTGSNGNNSYLMSVTNGVLNISGSIAPCSRFDVWNDATVILKVVTTARYWGCYCGSDTVTVHAGGRYEERGKLQFQGYRIRVEKGGTVVHDPTSYGPHPGMGTAQDVNIYGRYEAPNGIRRFGEWNDTPATSPGGSVTYFVHDGGELLLGGEVSRNTQVKIPFSIKFEDGCTLIASNTVTFAANMDLVKVMESAAVTMDVVEDATLDLANVTIGEGAAITKTGTGKLILRDAAVSSLAVSEGVVEIQADSVAPTTVSFAADTTLHLTVSGFRLDAVTAYDGMAFELDPSLIVAGAGIISSANAGFLAYAKNEIAELLPEGFGAAIIGDTVKLTKTSDYMFDASKSSDLSNPTAWKGGIVPVGEDVIVGGEGTVAFTADAPAFKSISVQAGATLSVSGGTEADPVDIPAVALSYDARLLISDYALLTNTLTTVGDATTLPVLEIATNAVVTAQTPGPQPLKCVFDHWSYHFGDYGFRLRNVKLRWYGTIKAAIQDLKTESKQSSLYLGYAAANETSYIAVDCQGGTWLASCEWNSSAHARAPLLVAVPDSGGTVVPVGTLLFRDYMRETQPATASGKAEEYRWSGICIGKASAWYTGNPASVEYDVVFEGSRTQLNSQGINHIGGGAHVTFRNGASWTYANVAYNDSEAPRGVALYEKATLTAESGAELGFWPSKSTYDGGNGIHVVSSQHAAGSAVFTARNATFSALAWKGSSAGIAVIEDAKLTIGNDRDHLATATDANTGVFANLSAARLDGDLTVSAANVWRPRDTTRIFEWNREVKIVPPLTGEGGLAVTNEMPSNLKQWGMTVVVTNGANTATGTARACETATGPANLVFADGANWAGTVVANAGLSLTNLTDGAAAATVSFGSIAGAMPIRVWKTDGVIVANDKVNVSGTAAAFDFVAMDEPLVVGDTVELGLYPENAALPANTRHIEYSSVASETAGFVTLRAKQVKPGLLLLIR